jgi:uncharacterized protein YecE (DUF72 family)
MNADQPIYVGRAGWSLARSDQLLFPTEGSHLFRYAQRLSAVEINSSFYRAHRHATYVRWAASVPDGFRFSVKMPRSITHEHRLVDVGDLLDRFFQEVDGLGARLGCILVQLPPRLALDTRIAVAFLAALRQRFDGPVALEPRHASWFGVEVEQLLVAARIARVAADPPPVDTAPHPAGWPGLVYYRLHGSPIVYHSTYDHEYLTRLAGVLAAHRSQGSVVWCVFDNTARGAATENALALVHQLRADRGPSLALDDSRPTTNPLMERPHATNDTR